MLQGFYSKPYRALLKNKQWLNFEELAELQLDVPANEKHWEFVAVALLAQFGYPKHRIEPNSAESLTLHRLLEAMNLRHHAANWRLMRKITTLATEGKQLSFADLADIDLTQASDGYLPDIHGDTSTQYHAYLAHLIAFFGNTEDTQLKDVLVKALVWLRATAQADGDPNARGRARLQLFGYASMAGLAASAQNRWGLPIDGPWLGQVFKGMDYAKNTGSLPGLWNTPVRHQTLLGYNTPDDYPAFADFWKAHCGLPKGATSSTDGRFFLHTTQGGAILLAQAGEGPFLVMQPALPGAGYKRGLRDILEAVKAEAREFSQKLKERYGVRQPVEEPFPQCVTGPLQVGNWVLNIQEKTIELTTHLSDGLCSTPEVVWLREGIGYEVFSQGCADIEEMQWIHADGAKAARLGGLGAPADASPLQKGKSVLSNFLQRVSGNHNETGAWRGFSVRIVRTGVVKIELRR